MVGNPRSSPIHAGNGRTSEANADAPIDWQENSGDEPGRRGTQVYGRIPHVNDVAEPPHRSSTEDLFPPARIALKCFAAQGGIEPSGRDGIDAHPWGENSTARALVKPDNADLAAL